MTNESHPVPDGDSDAGSPGLPEGDDAGRSDGEGAAADGPLDCEALEAAVIERIQTVFDPEIPVNIHELGLIYDVDIEPTGNVHINMTLTSPACPSAQELPVMVRGAVGLAPGVKEVEVDVVFDPPWTPEKMSEAARLQLGMM